MGFGADGGLFFRDDDVGLPTMSSRSENGRFGANRVRDYVMGALTVSSRKKWLMTTTVFVFLRKNPLICRRLHLRGEHCIIKTMTYMATIPKDQYISPKCEELDMNTEEVWLYQTSYHYQPGWDD